MFGSKFDTNPLAVGSRAGNRRAPEGVYQSKAGEARMIELSEYVPVNFISICVLGVLLLRRLVRMEALHWPRVVLLTVLLWVPAVYLILLSYAPATDYYYCTPAGGEPGHYAITE
jgi:uncharacterized membrane protein